AITIVFIGRSARALGWLHPNAYGRTALSLFAEHAATDKQTQAAQLLIKAGADVNISDNKGSIPLHKAAVRGDISMVKLLLEAGSNINVYNIYSDNPLDVAHFYNAQEQLDLMFSYKKDTCVIEAACFSQIKRLEQIIREGADIEHVHDDFQCQGTALIISAKRNNYNVVQKLLELGAKVNAKDTLGNTALHYAAQYGNDDILRSLLESGADINIRNQKGQKAYDLAVQNNKYRSVQIFKNKFPDIEVAKELPAKEKHIPDKADDSSKISSPAAVKQAVSKEEIKEQMIRQLLEQIQNPFHKAVVQGDLKTVQSMLEKGDVDVNKLDNLFSAPLMYAAYLGNSEILQLLINHGAKVNQTNQQGLTSLHLAAFSGQVDIAKQLLQAGADPSIEAMGGINALEAAMMYEQKEIAQLIQEKYPDLRADIKALPAEIMATEPNDIEADIRRMGDRMKVEEQQWKIKEYTSNTNKPLHMAVIQGNPDIVKKLLENKTLDVNETDRAGMLPLTYTTLLQNKEMAKLLIDHGANVNEIDKNIHAGGGGHTVGAEAGCGVLHYIAMDGDLDMLTFFLENGADVNMVERERGYSPLSIAFRFENEEMIRALAKAGADLKKPDKYGLTLFHQSARFGNMKILKFLLDLGVDIEFKDKGGNTALINACAGGQKDTLLFLLNQGANLNVLDNAGNNALHGAIMDPDSNETIRILIEHGLDVNHRNSQGQPPLFFLARNLVNLREGHFNSAQTMIKAGADLNIRDNNGDTILHLAAKKGAPELVTFLINKGLDVNQTNNQGLTAIQQILNLSCVADNDQKEEVVKILITNGANTNVFDQNGYMPLHDAVRLNLPKVVYFLVKNGADINAQSKNMETPLHVAVGHGYSPVIKVLLEAGARRDILNKYGQKAEDIARNARNEDVLLLFQ
ncbi:MAG: ankyrin repeat domain-containing protein, partial [Planctomycetota bacterium]|nr:ankyrin repeat domain-containing protein [Planctomycetota bacterium]